MDADQLRNIIEAALLVAARPMNLQQLEVLFDHQDDDGKPTREQIRDSLGELQQHYEARGIELVEVASGWRLQSRQAMSPWIANLYQEKAPRYSRALLETLVLIAYRQPITRGEIEDVRGVAVSANIIKTLIERDWVKVVGHRDVPGRPELLGSTRHFLDYFNLQKIGDLPTLSEIKALDEIAPDLAREMSMLEQNEANELPQDEAGDENSDADDGDTASEAPQLDAAEDTPEDDDLDALQSLAADEESNPSSEVAEANEVNEGEASDSADADNLTEQSSDSEAAQNSAESDGDGQESLMHSESSVNEQSPLTEDDESEEEDAIAEETLDPLNAAGESVIDVELTIEEEESGESAVEVASPDPDSSAEIDSMFDDAEMDNEELSVAEATIDAMSNVVRPETELVH